MQPTLGSSPHLPPLHPHCTPHCTPHRTHLQILARELWNSRQLKLGIIDNKGDCLFGTVAQQHFNDQFKHGQVRADLVTWVRANANKCFAEIQRAYACLRVTFKNVESYASYMSIQRRWAGELELGILVNHVYPTIGWAEVITVEDSGSIKKTSYFLGDPARRGSGIRVLYRSKNHFDIALTPEQYALIQWPVLETAGRPWTTVTSRRTAWQQVRYQGRYWVNAG